MQVKAEEIRTGDRFTVGGYTHWEALENAEQRDGNVFVPVRFGDGGQGHRVWDAGTEIDIDRTAVSYESMPGYNSDGWALLNVTKVTDRGTCYDQVREEVASYTLRYLDDTHEVVLLRGDEAVFSELLD